MLSDKNRSEIKHCMINLDENKRLEQVAEMILVLAGSMDLDTDDVFNEVIILIKGILLKKEEEGVKERYQKLYEQFSNLIDTLLGDNQ